MDGSDRNFSLGGSAPTMHPSRRHRGKRGSEKLKSSAVFPWVRDALLIGSLISEEAVGFRRSRGGAAAISYRRQPFQGVGRGEAAVGGVGGYR